MLKIFALILNYNRPQDTVSCAKALKKTDLGNELKIVIIDNGKKSKESYFTKHLGSSLVYLKSPRNLGFAAGNNQGIRYALAHAATHLLIINPDTLVPKNFFTPLLSTLKLGKHLGLVAPAIIEGDQTSYSLGVDFNQQLASPSIKQVSSLPDKPLPFDALTFACVLIKAEVIERVGELDERYFMYLEDVDYCLMAARAGYELYLDPRVVIKHAASTSFNNPVDKLPLSFRSHLQFIRKWYRFPKIILPLLYQLYLYPKLYLLWSLQRLRAALS